MWYFIYKSLVYVFNVNNDWGWPVIVFCLLHLWIKEVKIKGNEDIFNIIQEHVN